MKPPRFVYHDPATVEEALDLLARDGDDAQVLAGGQSLMPLLNFRLARPAHLIDINGIAALCGLEVGENEITLGALVRQRALERSPLIRERAPLIAQAMPYVGHPQTRNRGTLGGSLAHADPAAELPAIMVALDAQITLQRAGSERILAAEQFFVSALTTAREPDELLTRITLPPWPARARASLMEVAVRVGDFALAGVATTLTLGDDGRIARARIACFGVDERPVRVVHAEACLMGVAPGEAAFTEASRIVTERLHPMDDIHASAAYRTRLAGVLTRRALAASIPPPADTSPGLVA
jgi:carbon-monoxide dehydrogenase medium subunit